MKTISFLKDSRYSYVILLNELIYNIECFSMLRFLKDLKMLLHSVSFSAKHKLESRNKIYNTLINFLNQGKNQK